MFKYLGSKKLLIPAILELIPPWSGKVLDVFSGTCRVSYALKERGYPTIANDLNNYAVTSARCYLEAHKEEHSKEAIDILRELNEIKGVSGYFTDTFCVKSRFFHPKNGERIDAIREKIEERNYPEPLRSVLLVSLMEAADKVDSTCGVQMAYLKSYATRAHHDIRLNLPPLLPKVEGCKAILGDAATVGERVGKIDIAYLDPPYNQHSYLGNYHIWESLVLWDKPEVYGIACKRVDVQDRKSDFNSKVRIKSAFEKTIKGIDAQTYIVSFSNEGYLSEADILGILQQIGTPSVIRHDYNRYVGAKIGIHNDKGEVVGRVSHTKNEELIFVVNK